MEKKRVLVRQDDVNQLIDKIAGITLAHLSGMAARCSRDLQVRRNTTREIAEACSKAADECNEPLDPDD